MSASAAEFYYVDQANQRQGPVTEGEVFRLAGDGVIAADTLLWTAGMTDWRRADSFDRFASLFERTMIMPGPSATSVPPPAAPPMPSPSQPGRSRPSFFPTSAAAPESRGRSATAAPIIGQGGALVATLPVWGLFGRAILAFIGTIFVIPSPWTSTILYSFVSDNIAMPDGTRLRFLGQPTDIWLVFIIIALSLWLRQVPYGGLPSMLISWSMGVLVLRWLCEKMETVRAPLSLSFQGEILPYIGWNVLLILSFITIIGWAWVMRAMIRWICQNIRGSVGFEFQATAVELLWRGFALGFGCIFVIPIPWLMQWYANWLISQFHVVPARA